MKRNAPDHDTFELLPNEGDRRNLQSAWHGSTESVAFNTHGIISGAEEFERTRRTLRSRLIAAKGFLLFWLPLIVATVPFILLLAYSKRLSQQLRKSACTHGGNFVLPYTSSIWVRSSFFEITIPFSGAGSASCEDSENDFFGQDCVSGYSFTQVKVIDAAWDVLIGRGGQAILVAIAYKVFSLVINSLMEQGEVGYDAFATVAFESGSFSSTLTLIRHALGMTPIPRTNIAMLSYVGMALGTMYIAAWPTLTSTMTGYTSNFEPYITSGKYGAIDPAIYDCQGGILPVWGLSGMYNEGGSPYNNLLGQPINYMGLDVFPLTAETYPYWIQYYYRYKSVYDECPQTLNLSSCPAAHQTTSLVLDGMPITLAEPMPGIVPFQNTTTRVPTYSHWLCGFQIFDVNDLVQYPETPIETDTIVNGVCIAANNYVWGFSFLLTLLVSILQLAFIMIMYALWLNAQRQRTCAERRLGHGVVKDAVLLTTSAQKDYGQRVGDWTSDGLKKELLRGKRGMTFASDESIKRRYSLRRNEELGDSYSGDWGGDVVIHSGG